MTLFSAGRAPHIPGMTQTPSLRTVSRALALGLALATQPALAGDGQDTAGNPDIAAGREMITEGLKKLFEGLKDEFEPAGEAAEQGWNDLVTWLGDLSAFEAPERLPNGDILIRRKIPLDEPATDL